MLKIVYGDLFDYAKPGSIIAHGCNCQGKMNAGFARTLRQKFPKAYLEYYRAYTETRLELGSFILVHAARFAVFNLITQIYYGKTSGTQYVEYAAVRNSLTHVANYAIANALTVHLPLIGGGYGGGCSIELTKIFTEVFKKADAVLYLPQNGDISNVSVYKGAL